MLLLTFGFFGLFLFIFLLSVVKLQFSFSFLLLDTWGWGDRFLVFRLSAGHLTTFQELHIEIDRCKEGSL